MNYLPHIILGAAIISILIFLFIKKIIKTFTFILTLLGSNLVQRFLIAGYYYYQTRNINYLFDALINPIKYYDSILFENIFLSLLGLISWFIFFFGVSLSIIKSFIENPLETELKKHERIIFASALSLLFMEGFSGGLTNVNKILYYAAINFLLPLALISAGFFLIWKGIELFAISKQKILEEIAYITELYETAKMVYPDVNMKIISQREFFNLINKESITIKKESNNFFIIQGSNLQGEIYELKNKKYAIIYREIKNKTNTESNEKLRAKTTTNDKSSNSN